MCSDAQPRKNRPEPRTSNPKDDGTPRPHRLPLQARILDDGTVVVCVVEGRGLRSLPPSPPPPPRADPASDANVRGLPGSTAADIFQTPPCTFFFFFLSPYNRISHWREKRTVWLLGGPCVDGLLALKRPLNSSFPTFTGNKHREKQTERVALASETFSPSLCPSRVKSFCPSRVLAPRVLNNDFGRISPICGVGIELRAGEYQPPLSTTVCGKFLSRHSVGGCWWWGFLSGIHSRHVPSSHESSALNKAFQERRTCETRFFFFFFFAPSVTCSSVRLGKVNRFTRGCRFTAADFASVSAKSASTEGPINY